MAQIDIGNQFMSLSALAHGKCKASFQTESINAFQDEKPWGFQGCSSLLGLLRGQGRLLDM